MQTLLDASFLVAIAHPREFNHQQCIEASAKLRGEILIPTVVLAECTHLLHQRYGHFVMRRFVTGVRSGPFQLIEMEQTDFGRVSGLLEKYSDSDIDFADCCLVAIAERMNIAKIATLDRRDFSIIRPKHIPFFNLLPE